MMQPSKLLSQSGKKIDTAIVCLPEPDALYHLSRSDSLTQYKKLLKEKQKDIDSLYKAIELQRQTIGEYQSKDSIYKHVDELNTHVISLLESDKTILAAEIKRLKRSRTGDRIIQGTITIVLGYLALKK